MKAVLLLDLFLFREDPFVTEPLVRSAYEMLRQHGQQPHLSGQIDFKLLLTQYEAADAPFVITLPRNAVTAMSQLLAKWNQDSIQQWINLMRGEGEIAAIYQDILHWVFKTHGVDAFLYWGTNHTVRKFAQAMGIHSFAMELGPTRRPFSETRYFDPFGVNGDAYAQHLKLNDYPPLDLAGLPYELGLRGRFGDSFDQMYRPVRSAAADQIYAPKDRKALVALQLDDDSNCLVHSQYSGMEQMVRQVVPQLVDSGYQVFVKPHPGADPKNNRGRSRWLNVSAHQACRDFIAANYPEEGEVIWLDDVDWGDYISLMTKMDLVVSVNSSLGFEGLLLGKTVVALGSAPYNIGRCLPSLDEATGRDFDRAGYLENASRIARAMLHYYLYPQDLLANPARLASALDRGVCIQDAYERSGWSGVSEFVRHNPTQLVTF